MKDITLIIPAKEEPNALPMVLNEIKKKELNVKILVVLHESDTQTLNSIKAYNCEILFQTQRVMEIAKVSTILKQNILVYIMLMDRLIQSILTQCWRCLKNKI